MLKGKSADFKNMIEVGWEWRVVPASACVAWPTLPDVFQQALNASHSVGNDAGELEVTATIAEEVETQIAKGDKPDYAAAAKLAVAANPTCAPYVGKLADFAKLYGGGIGYPIVKRLDAFAKRQSGGRRLGEEFMTAIVDTKFSEDGSGELDLLCLGILNVGSPIVVAVQKQCQRQHRQWKR